MGRAAAIAGVALLLLTFPGAARAACPLSGTQNYARKADLPAAAVAALGFPMAERGAPFQITDVILPGRRLPSARFIAARRTACTIALRYELGGIARRFETAILERRGNNWVLVRER